MASPAVNLAVIFFLAMPGLNAECDFPMGKQIINCDNAISSISDLSHLIDSTTSVIVLRNIDKLTISARSHQDDHFRHLTSYKISRVEKLEVEENGFVGLSGLLNLIVTDSSLNTLNKRAFNGLSKLQRLELTNCNIENIHDQAFAGLKSLQSLDLTHNGLKSISKELFKDLENVVTLSLYRNNIQVLDDDCFKNMKNLIDLDLSTNNLKSLNTAVVNSIPKLSYLYLSFNHIDTIIGNFECNYLKFLYLKQNNLKEIPRHLFSGSRSLADIDLAYNPISTIDENAFNNLPALMNLHLRSCTADISNLKFIDKPLIIV